MNSAAYRAAQQAVQGAQKIAADAVQGPNDAQIDFNAANSAVLRFH